MPHRSRPHARRVEDHHNLFGWLLRPARRITIVILYLILCVFTTFLAYQYHGVRNAETRLRATVATATTNRASNVAAWCKAINQLDRSLTGYADIARRAEPRVPRLRLKLLPCAQLERDTLASDKSH